MNIYTNDDINLFKNLSKKLMKDDDCVEFPKKFLDFLGKEVNDEYIMLHLSINHLFINTVLLDDTKITDKDISLIKEWDGDSQKQWISDCSMTDFYYYIESPMEQYSPSIFCDGEPIFFIRSFEYAGYEYYYEINQKILQILNLHYIYEENAWCKFDDLGDLEKIIQFKKITDGDNHISILFMRKKELDIYCTLTKQNIIRMMDVTFVYENFTNWNHNNFVKQEISKNQIYGELTMDKETGSFFRGIQIISSPINIQTIINERQGKVPKQYVDLIVNDIKYKKVHSISCDPNKLDNYFVDTGKPLNMSIAFFKPEVLRKYKSDTEKYTIQNRQISCRDAWYLRSFDINDNQQISVYLVDFNKLPYQEQLHWQQYNEEPKGFISKRAIQNDFLGEFSDDIRLEEKLKIVLQKLQKQKCFWWTLRSESNLLKLHTPLTNSADEWADELLNLDQLIVEGFQEKELKRYCTQHNIEFKNSDRSLKLIGLILSFKGFDDEQINEIMSPLYEVHNLRSEQKGHSSGETALNTRKKIRKDYGNFSNHYNYLLKGIIETLQILKDELI